MNDLVIVKYSDIVDIADAIRNKTGNNNDISIGEMSSIINNITGKADIKTYKVTFPVIDNTLIREGTLIYCTRVYDGEIQHHPYNLCDLCRNNITIDVIENTYLYCPTDELLKTLHPNSGIIVYNDNLFCIIGDVTFSLDDGAPQ